MSSHANHVVRCLVRNRLNTKKICGNSEEIYCQGLLIIQDILCNETISNCTLNYLASHTVTHCRKILKFKNIYLQEKRRKKKETCAGSMKNILSEVWKND